MHNLIQLNPVPVILRRLCQNTHLFFVTFVISCNHKLTKIKMYRIVTQTKVIIMIRVVMRYKFTILYLFLDLIYKFIANNKQIFIFILPKVQIYCDIHQTYIYIIWKFNIYIYNPSQILSYTSTDTQVDMAVFADVRHALRPLGALHARQARAAINFDSLPFHYQVMLLLQRLNQSKSIVITMQQK